VTGRAVNGLSWCDLDRIGEIKEEKTGGANVCAKKDPCERDPLRELHVLHALTQLSGLIA
jgi:hypothetical protein